MLVSEGSPVLMLNFLSGGSSYSWVVEGYYDI
jgi:hypothetical protein